MQRLIKEFDQTNPVCSPPPENQAYVWGYTRSFFRESETFPRDIFFNDDFGPEDILTEEYNLKDRIAYIDADIDAISYSVKFPWGERIPIGPWHDDPLWITHLDWETENSDLSLNGLYHSVPEEKIPRHSRGYEDVVAIFTGNRSLPAPR